jgi:hypothetical protein
MSTRKYSKYIISNPSLVTELAHHDLKKVSGFTFPDEIYLDKDILEEANHWVDITWIWDRTTPRELPGAHSHGFNEIVLLVGSNARNLRDLGGEVEWGMGEGKDAETYLITSTTLIFVPKGLVHGPLVFKKVDRPILNIAIGINTGKYA